MAPQLIKVSNEHAPRWGGCQEETAVTPMETAATSPPDLLPTAYVYGLGSTGERVLQGEGNPSAQQDTIGYRSDPDQLPRQSSILAAAEPDLTASPETSGPCSVGLSSLPRQTAGTDRPAAPGTHCSRPAEPGSCCPSARAQGLAQLMLGVWPGAGQA